MSGKPPTKKRFRRHGDDPESSEEEDGGGWAPTASPASAPVGEDDGEEGPAPRAGPPAEEEDDWDREEAARATDQAEKDAFHARLLARDAANTRRLGDGSGPTDIRIKKAEQLAGESRDHAFQDMRKDSRRHYLGKRTDKEMELLRTQIEYDEEVLLPSMSAAELRQHELNKEIYAAAMKVCTRAREHLCPYCHLCR